MRDFCVGDRVKVIDKDSKHYGRIGVVECLATPFSAMIQFDNERYLMSDSSLRYAFQKGDVVTYHCEGIERTGTLQFRFVSGRWRVAYSGGYTIGVEESEMKPVHKKTEENKIMKAEAFVTDIFKRIADYIQKKGEEVIDTIIEEDKNWKEAQECMKKLKDLHALYYPNKDITIDYSFGNFCSPTTMSNAQKVHERLTELLFTISRKKDLVLHALQVDENMSSEAVFKLLRSYGLTDQTGRVLPVTEELICDLLELPVDEKLF